MKASNAAVLAFLKVRGLDGATEAEIQQATAIRSGAQRIHELKAEGHVIDKVMEQSPIGARYARWFYRAPRPTFQPVTGTQRGMFQ